MPTPNDRDHEISPEEPGRTVYWSAAIDNMEEARRLLVLAREEIFQGELNADRAGQPQLSADASVVGAAVLAEADALKAAMDRSVSR